MNSLLIGLTMAYLVSSPPCDEKTVIQRSTKKYIRAASVIMLRDSRIKCPDNNAYTYCEVKTPSDDYIIRGSCAPVAAKLNAGIK